jgi:hypothetical protein
LLALDASLVAQPADYDLLRRVLRKNTDSLASWCALLRDRKVTDFEMKKASSEWEESSGNKKLVLSAVCMGKIPKCKNYFWSQIRSMSKKIEGVDVNDLMGQDSATALKTYYGLQDMYNSLTILFLCKGQRGRVVL